MFMRHLHHRRAPKGVPELPHMNITRHIWSLRYMVILLVGRLTVASQILCLAISKTFFLFGDLPKKREKRRTSTLPAGVVTQAIFYLG
jgi:hypothetical protein